MFNAGLYKSPPYDPLKDLVPVALILNIAYSLVGSPTCPTRRRKKSSPQPKPIPAAIKLANAGVGTGQHVVGAAFQAITGTKMLDVPYRGSSLAFPDLLRAASICSSTSTPGRIALYQVGTGERHCGSGVEAPSRCAGHADHDRIGRAGPGDRFLDRDFRAGQDTARRHRVLQKHIAEAGPEMKPKLASCWRRTHGRAAPKSSTRWLRPTMTSGSRSSRTPASASIELRFLQASLLIPRILRESVSSSLGAEHSL